MADPGLRHKLDLAAVAVIESGGAADLPSGVQILDRWRSGDRAAVLFWAGAEVDVWSFGHGDAAWHISVLHFDRGWRIAGGGGSGARTAAEYVAKGGVGLHRLGGSYGAATRWTIAVASPEVSLIELRRERSVSSRSPGVDGFCLFGALDSDPITFARPVDAHSEQVGSQSVLL